MYLKSDAFRAGLAEMSKDIWHEVVIEIGSEMRKSRAECEKMRRDVKDSNAVNFHHIDVKLDDIRIDMDRRYVVAEREKKVTTRTLEGLVGIFDIEVLIWAPLKRQW